MDECRNCSDCKHMNKLEDRYEDQCWYECEIIPYAGMIKSTDPFECECWEGMGNNQVDTPCISVYNLSTKK